MKANKRNKVIKYISKHPSAKPASVAKAAGTTYGYAYKVMRSVLDAVEDSVTTKPNTLVVEKSLTSYKGTQSSSDGSSADYYVLPNGAKELQDLISHKNMNAQIGEIFRSCYRYGEVAHSKMLRDAKKIKFYAEAEIKRLEKLDGKSKI